MKAERWQRIERLYHSALALPLAERTEFLSSACAEDKDLQHEVESLLRHDQGAQFLESPAVVVLAQELARDAATAPLQEGDTISHYRICNAVGRGGMGVVYKAEDNRLRRMVALKLLPGGLALNPQVLKRFEREAQAASALSHPNICTVYEIDEAEGLHFIAIEFLDGETLKDRIARGPLPPSEVVSIAIQICRALATAHVAGIIHRDIKPANIFLTRGGVAKVLDFGVAKRVGVEWTPENTKFSPTEITTVDRELTVTGTKVGTVAYMSPEQTRGDVVDSRTDLFSLGTVLYEMASAKRPFSGETVGEVFTAIQKQQPRSLVELAPQIPATLNKVVLKALEKGRGVRYQRADDLRKDLEEVASRLESPNKPASKIMMASLAVVMACGLAFGLWKLGHRSASSSRIQSLAVLPLENLTGDATQEYFADGMTNALITNLTKVGSLRVISRGSAMVYKGSKKPVAEIARDLNVNAVVEGTVVRSGNRVRITAELVDAQKGANLWAQNYDRDLQDVLQLQSEVAWDIVKQVQAQLTPAQKQRITSFSHCAPNAYDFFQQGMNYWFKDAAETNEMSKRYFDQAVEADPNCAEAYFGIGAYYAIEADQGNMPPKIAWTEDRKANLKAIELDPNHGGAYMGLAAIDFLYDWNWLEAERMFRKALELNPGYSDNHNEYGVFLRSMGRFDEAETAIKRSIDLDPLQLSLRSSLAWTYFFARRWDDCVTEFKAALARDPQYLPAHEGLAKCYLQQGKGKEAIDELAIELRAAGADPDADLLENAYKHAGTNGALKALYTARIKEYQEAASQMYVSPMLFANLYTLLNEKNEAFRWLEKAYQERSSKMTDLKIDPDYDNLRGDPRFDNLIKRVGLP